MVQSLPTAAHKWHDALHSQPGHPDNTITRREGRERSVRQRTDLASSGLHTCALSMNINPRGTPMLQTVAIVLIILWLLGMVSSYTMGGFIHILLVIAVVMFLVRLIGR